MVILGILAVSTLGAISARTAVGFANTLLHAAENMQRESRHTVCGHEFVCQTNNQFAVLESAFKTIEAVSESIVQKAELEAEDVGPMKQFVLEGALVWGMSGMDIRGVVLSKIQDESLGQDISDAIIECFDSLPAEKKHELFLLHTLSA